MAVGLLLIGVALTIVGFRGTQDQLGALLKADGPGYLKWAGAIFGIWLLGLVPGLQSAGKYLLALVLLAIVIANKGAFANLQQAFLNPPAASQAPAEPAPQQQSSSGGGGLFGGLSNLLGGLFGGGGAASAVGDFGAAQAGLGVAGVDAASLLVLA